MDTYYDGHVKTLMKRLYVLVVSAQLEHTLYNNVEFNSKTEMKVFTKSRKTGSFQAKQERRK